MSEEKNLEQVESDSKGRQVWILAKQSAYRTYSDSKVHGVSNILKNESWILRVFWIVLLLTSTGFALYFCYLSSKSYFNYDVSVSIEAVDTLPLEFPAVTVCNQNPFNLYDSKTQEFLRGIMAANNLPYTLRASDTEPATYLVQKNMKILKANSYSKSNTNPDYTKQLGFSLDTMLISCYFNGRRCYADNFTQWFSFDFGNCFTFNKFSSSSPAQTTSQTGPMNGLSMELFVGVPDESLEFYMISYGAYIAVHNNSQYLLTRYDGIKVPTGYTSDIGFTRIYYSKQPSPFSSCVDTNTTSYVSSYFQYTISISHYSRKLCFEICLQYEYITKNCSCSDPSVPFINTGERPSPVCSNSSQLDCVSLIRERLDSVSSNCEDFCPMECERYEYRASMGISNYPTDYYYEVISSQPNLIRILQSFGVNVSREMFKNSMLSVNVFYSSLVYESITESPALSFSDVIGVIGGQFGLFLGASTLAFFEVFEFLINWILMVRSCLAIKKIKANADEK